MITHFRVLLGIAAVASLTVLAEPTPGALIFTPVDQQMTGNTSIGSFTSFSGDDVYIGLTVDWQSGSVGSNEFYVLWFDDQNAQNIGIKGNQGPDGTDFIVRHESGDSGAYSPTQLTIPSSARLVGHLEKTTPGPGQPYDQFSLWVDPASETNPTPVVTTAHDGDTSISSLGKRAANNNDTVFFRDIVVATTFNEASLIPEPSSLALALLGLLLIPVATRRRCNRRNSGE